MANENEIQATGTFVTRKGLSLITKLAAAQGELNFTRAAVGTGKPPEGYAPDALINLNAYRMDAEISEYGIRDDKAYITMQVSCEEVQEGFLLTEVGVFAQDPDEGEILYGYMDVSTDPTYIYANGSSNRLKFAEFTLYVLIGSVDRVTAAVTPGSIITRETLTAENLRTIDTGGIVGEAGADITGQSWMDAITNKIANELITNEKLIERLGNYILRSQIVNNLLATQVGNVLDATQGKALMDRITQLNSDITVLNTNYTNLNSSVQGMSGVVTDHQNILAEKQNREWNSLCNITRGQTIGIGMSIYNYREAAIIINGYRTSDITPILPGHGTVHFIAPEAGNGDFCFIYLVQITIQNNGLSLYAEKVNRLAISHDNAWIEQLAWPANFNIYAR